MTKYELKNLIKQCLLESAKGKNNNIPDETEGSIEGQIQAYRNNGSKGDLDLSNRNLTKFPDVLQLIDVGRDFNCNDNQLISLEGAPKRVGGIFSCARNQLTSLVGAPTSVGEDFYCNRNQLRSLKGAPKIVSGIFSCNDNQLRSLVGAPTSVGGSFDCRKNKLTSLVGAPTSVGEDFYCGNNAVKFTEEQVRSVCDVKGKIII
jgi:hypothetical protein